MNIDFIRKVKSSDSRSRSPGGNGENDKFEVGTRVEARYRGKAKYYPGKITRCRSNSTYDVLYDDGEKELGVNPSFIKLQEGASNQRSHQGTDDERKYEVGDKVEAQYRGKSQWIEGEISKVRPGELYDITYVDSKFESRVTRDKIRFLGKGRKSPKKSDRRDRDSSDDNFDAFESVESPKSQGRHRGGLVQGMKVEARYKGKSKWYKGKIMRARLNGTYDIEYEDGDREDSVAEDLIRQVEGGKSPKTPSGSGRRRIDYDLD